jgi:hypothetical protein
MEKDSVKLESFWTRRSGLLTTLIALFVFAINFLQDIFLSTEGFSRWSIVAISDIITGAIAGALFYQFAKNEKNRRELIRERMRTIAELNHHIRNALQVIKFWGAQHQNCVLDDMQIRLMKDSVDRIEWALREVLPKYPIASGVSISDAQEQLATPLAAPELSWRNSAAHNESAAQNEREHPVAEKETKSY